MTPHCPWLQRWRYPSGPAVGSGVYAKLDNQLRWVSSVASTQPVSKGSARWNQPRVPLRHWWNHRRAVISAGTSIACLPRRDLQWRSHSFQQSSSWERPTGKVYPLVKEAGSHPCEVPSRTWDPARCWTTVAHDYWSWLITDHGYWSFINRHSKLVGTNVSLNDWTWIIYHCEPWISWPVLGAFDQLLEAWILGGERHSLCHPIESWTHQRNDLWFSVIGCWWFLVNVCSVWLFKFGV